jgi:zinc transporter
MDIENNGLLGAWLITAEGHAETLDWRHLDDEVEPGAWRWIHLHRDGNGTQSWLLDGEIPPNQIAWALMAEDTRPRYTEIDGTGLLFLRGVNLNDGAEPEDMISLRLSIDRQTVITVGLRRLQTVDAMMADFEHGHVPDGPGDFLETLVQNLRARAEPVLDELEEIIAQHELDALRDAGVPKVETRNAFTDARQDAVMLRRYLVPQAEALRSILRHRPAWMHSADTLEEEAAAHDRIVEDLDSLRERAAVLRDEMSARLAERMNEIMLALSIVSVVFLPITFVTGLFGMNVAGLPFTEIPWGFWIVCGFMLSCTAFTAFMLWRMLRQ